MRILCYSVNPMPIAPIAPAADRRGDEGPHSRRAGLHDPVCHREYTPDGVGAGHRGQDGMSGMR